MTRVTVPSTTAGSMAQNHLSSMDNEKKKKREKVSPRPGAATNVWNLTVRCRPVYMTHRRITG